MRHPAFVEQLPRSLELVAGRYAEAEMIESDPRLIEPIVGRSATGIRVRPQTQADAPLLRKTPEGRSITNWNPTTSV
jgi:hypothetical protein